MTAILLIDCSIALLWGLLEVYSGISYGTLPAAKVSYVISIVYRESLVKHLLEITHGATVCG